MEDFIHNGGDVELDEIPDLNRSYFESLVGLVSDKTSRSADYHKYYHYTLDELTKKWSEPEKANHKKMVSCKEFGCPRTCKFCGCVRRSLNIQTRKVKRVKRKFFSLLCKFCGKSMLINKAGSRILKMDPTTLQSNESTTNSEMTVSKRQRTRIKAKPIEKVKSNVPIIMKAKKIEKFSEEDTIQRLNFLLKGGIGGKKVNIQQSNKSRLMDLLM